MTPEKKLLIGKFSTRGRVTIPAAWRRKFGITGKSRVTLVATEADLLLKPEVRTRRRR